MKLQIKVLYLKGDEPFIFEIHGKVTTDILVELEKDMTKNAPDIFNKGDGDYSFSVGYEPAQRGEFGRIEIPEYYPLDLIDFDPMKKSEKTA